MSEFFLPAVFAFGITVLATPLTIVFARKAGLIDDPATHKHPGIIHSKPTPRGGGVAIFVGIAIASLLFLPASKLLIMILAGALLAVIIGVLDDKYDLSPYSRFVSNFVVAALPVLGGITVLFITNPLGAGIISFDNLRIPFGFMGKETIVMAADIIAVVWIVWTMNMLNWSTGVNGQMPGIAAIAAITIGLLSLRFSPVDETSLITAKLSFITAGAAAGFLPFNFPKARIFPGYSGTIIGFMLAVLAIVSGAKVATALLVMGIPTIDAVVTIVRRLSSKRSPFRGDRGHFHHLLLERGWKVWHVAVFYWALSLLLGGLALTFSSKQKLFAFLVLGIVIGGGLLWFSLFSKRKN